MYILNRFQHSDYPKGGSISFSHYHFDQRQMTTNAFGQTVAVIDTSFDKNPVYDSKASNGRVVGDSSFLFDEYGKLLSVNESTRTLDSSITADPVMLSYVQGVVAHASQLMDQPVKAISKEIHGIDKSRAEKGCRWFDCPAGQLVSDAFLYRCNTLSSTGCHFAFVNAGGIRGSLLPPYITERTLSKILPFATNAFVVMEMPGSIILEMLETNAKRNHGRGGFLQFSEGIRIVFQSGNAVYADTPAAAVDSRTSLLTVEIKDKTTGSYVALNKNAFYRVSTTDFLLLGYDGYSMLPALRSHVISIEQFTQGNMQVVTKEYIEQAYANRPLDYKSKDEMAPCHSSLATEPYSDGNITQAGCRVVLSFAKQPTSWYGTCPAGRFRDHLAHPPRCEGCPLGRFYDGQHPSPSSSLPTPSQCQQCPAGRHASGKGSTTCQLCTPDQWSGAGAAECTNCPAGSRRVVPFDTRPVEQFSVPQVGISSGQCACKSEFYVVDGRRGERCLPCPTGGVCRGGNSLPYPRNGYWADMTVTETTNEPGDYGPNQSALYILDPDPTLFGQGCIGATDHSSDTREYYTTAETATQMHKCPHADACTGGDAQKSTCFQSPAHLTTCSKGVALCATGTTGRLCAVCEDGFFPMGKGCRECGGPIHPVFLFLILIAVFVGAVLMCVLCRFGYAKFAKYFPRIWAAIFDIGRFKVIFATAQIVGSISKTTGVVWPDPFASLADIFAFFVEMFNILPMNCTFKAYNHFDRLFSLSLLPFACVAMIWANYKIAVMTGASPTVNFSDTPLSPRSINASSRQRQRRTQSQLSSDDVAECFSLPPVPPFAWCKLTFEQAFKYSLLVIYTFLPTVSLAIFDTFKCIAFADGTHWLRVDLSVECYTPQYDAVLGFAIVMIVVWPIGVPALFAWMLHARRDDIVNRQPGAPLLERAAPMSFLFEMYDNESYFAEVSVVADRLTHHRQLYSSN